MANKNFDIQRLTDRLPNLLPDFVMDEAPVFEQFLKAYFEFLEAEILTLSSQGDLDEILLENDEGYLLVEEKTVEPAPDASTSRLLHEQQKTPFEVGDYLVGSKTGSVAEIKIINGNTFYIETIEGKGFDSGETVSKRYRRDLGEATQTGVVESYKHNTVLANNQLLNYSDVDTTTEEFLDYFQKDFIPSLDIDDTKDARLTIKNINDLYQKKGTGESLQFLLRILFGQDAEIIYPIDQTIFASESDYSDKRRIAVTMNNVNHIPSATDKVIQYQDDLVTILAEAIVENVYTINASLGQYSLEISNNHFGTFEEERPCDFVDRDGVTTVSARVKGILSDIVTTDSSIYMAQEDNDSILLEPTALTGNLTIATNSTTLIGSSSKFLRELKVGDTISYKVSNTVYTDTIATVTDDVTATLTANGSAAATNVIGFNNSTSGGLLLEEQSFGSMYSLNDPLFFEGGKADRDESNAKGVIDGLRKGGVEQIFIEDAGTGYNGGDILVFDNSGADGNAAEGVIGAIEDVVILENRTDIGQFEITATAGQTVFNGRDNNGKRIFFNDNSVRVFVNGIEKTPYTDYTFKNDRVTFTSGQTAGHLIEIYTDFNHLLMEDGDRIQLTSTDSRIRNTVITSPGTGYTKLPQVFPGGYIYLSDLSGFVENEVVTGGTSNATAVIVRKEEKDGKKRLVVKRRSTDSNQFTQSGETITGGTSGTQRAADLIKVSSGTGAKLLAYSDEIGGVGHINVKEQGFNFKENPIMSSLSHYKALITTPTATLNANSTFTGRITGSTGKIISFDANTQVLTFTDLDGHFLDNEEVLFNSVDTFKVLKFNPYQSRGKLGGEGIIERQLLTDKGTIDSSAVNVQDGYVYQTHSYIVKVGESINRWRSVVKDLVHPSGHIFFGEVAIKQFVNPHDSVILDSGSPRNEVGIETETRFNFIPTIIMQAFPTYHFDLEGADSLYRDDESNIIMEDGYHLILEEAPDINAITELLTTLMLYTNASDLNTPLIVHQPFDESSIGSTTPVIKGGADIVLPNNHGLGPSSLGENFKQRRFNIEVITSLANAIVRKTTRTITNPMRQSKDVSVEYNGIRNVYNINGLRNASLVLQRGYTYDFGYPNAHPLRLSTTSDGTHNSGSAYTTGVVTSTYVTSITVDSNTPDTLHYYCQHHNGMGGQITVIDTNRDTTINIDNVNNPSHSPYERRMESYRTADLGIVIPSVQMEEENIVYEDGGRMHLEVEVPLLRMESTFGDHGGTFMTEDGFNIAIEDGTYMSEPLGSILSERVLTLHQSSMLTEDNFQITLEDGGVMLDESTQGQTLTSYAPVSYKLGDINNLVNQDIYKISHYLLDEDVSNDADEDHIVLEDGYGSVLLEDSDPSGLTFDSMQSLLPSMRIKNFDIQNKKRSNIAHSAYVKSSKITNSTLSSL